MELGESGGRDRVAANDLVGDGVRLSGPDVRSNRRSNGTGRCCERFTGGSCVRLPGTRRQPLAPSTSATSGSIARNGYRASWSSLTSGNPKTWVDAGELGGDWTSTLLNMFLDRITVDPERMNGRPCVRNVRVTVATVLGQLAAGQTREQILADYPYLEDEDITASLEYGAARVSEREVQVARLA